MKNKFVKGDRVRVYGPLLGEVNVSGQIATVKENSDELGPPEGWITVMFRAHDIDFVKHVHPKQCRRLKPREKSVRITKSLLRKSWKENKGHFSDPDGIGANGFSAQCKALGLE
jgi:hypothetical protein